MMLVILGAVLLATVFLCLRKHDKRTRISKIYTRAGRWYYLKFCIMYLVLRFRHYVLKVLNWEEDEEYSQAKKDVEELEKIKELSNNFEAFDSVYFQGCSKEGIHVSIGCERRHKGKVNAEFYVFIPKIGLLKSIWMPNAYVDGDSVSISSNKFYGAAGIKLTPVEAMKKWRIQFNGPLKTEHSNEVVEVNLDAEFLSANPYFSFDVDMNNCTVARALAKETWSRKLLNNLKKAYETHYQQVGSIKGCFMIDGVKYQIDLDSIRDHSYGHNRDWSSLHRYVFHTLHLEDKTCITLGVISHPSTVSHLEVGYVLNSRGELNEIIKCNLYLYQHGENGRPGKNVGFSVWTSTERYDIKTETVVESEHFKGINNEARLIQRFLTCHVNGFKGKGGSEWQYNNV